MNKAQRQRLRRWGDAGLWVVCIYSTLYIVRPVCEFLKGNTPFNVIVNLGMSGLFAGLVILFFKKVPVRRKSTYLLLFLTAVMYGAFFLWLEIPEERVHLVEYGFLAFLIFRAVVPDGGNARAYTIAFVLTALFGWGDEGIQYLLPNRYYQFKDVLLNALSGGMGLWMTFVMRREQPNISCACSSAG